LTRPPPARGARYAIKAPSAGRLFSGPGTLAISAKVVPNETAGDRLVGWTRPEWINEVESAVGEAFILFCQAKLAERNGQRRHAKTWASEFDRLLFRKIVEIHVRPVKREFDRKEAFEEAVLEMLPGTIPALQEHVERQFEKTVVKRRRGIDEMDVNEFWKTVRGAATMLTGEGGRAHRLPGSSRP
jgi:hypothetical protein